MQIQVNTDDNVEGREALARRVEAEVSQTLSHFSDQVTRVEVHLSDEDSEKSGRTTNVVSWRRGLPAASRLP